MYICVVILTLMTTILHTLSMTALPEKLSCCYQSCFCLCDLCLWSQFGITLAKPRFTIRLVMTSGESNVCLHATCDCMGPCLCDNLNARMQTWKKSLLSYDVTTKVLVKWGLLLRINLFDVIWCSYTSIQMQKENKLLCHY